MNPMRLLVIRGGAIGDFVLTLPVFSALRHRFPGSRIEVLGYPHIAALAMAGGFVEDVHSIEAPELAGFFVEGGTRNRSAEQFFSRFDLIISFVYDPDKTFQRNVGACSNVRYISGVHRPNEGEDVHCSRVLLRCLECLEIVDSDSVPRLSVAGGADRVGGSVSQSAPIVAIHPGSGSVRKNWPEANWIALIKLLAARTSCKFLVIGGEAELGRASRVAGAIDRDRASVLENLPLTRLAQELGQVSLFVGHDSGVSHMAAALGLQSLILWGKTNEKIWRPPGDTVQLLHAPEDELSNLSVEAVFERVSGLLRLEPGTMPSH